MADESTNPEKNYRDLGDLSRAIRAVAERFHVDRVYIIAAIGNASGDAVRNHAA